MLQIHDKESIKAVLIDSSARLKEFGVVKIGLFGSYVRGAQTVESDIDLLVEMKKERKTLRNFLALTYFLEEILLQKVDLVTSESLGPHIGPGILRSVEYVDLEIAHGTAPSFDALKIDTIGFKFNREEANER